MKALTTTLACASLAVCALIGCDRQPVHATTHTTESIAAKEHFLMQKVSRAYGEKHPFLKKVDPRYTSNPHHTNLFIITLWGHFKEGNLKAKTLEYHISADGRRIWDIEGFASTAPDSPKTKPIWRDKKLR